MHSPPELPCQVCEAPAHGNHFGAMTCRACSAFFRRAIIDKSGDGFSCLRGNGKCQVKNLGKYPTRSRQDQNPAHPPTSDHFDSCGPPIIHNPLLTAQSHFKKSIVDVTYLIDKASECLDFGPQLLSNEMKILERMYMANEFLEAFEASEFSNFPKNLTQIPVIDKQFFMHYWEVDFLKTAKWLSYLDGFQNIPRVVQIQILMTTWHLRARLDRLCRTAKLRRKMKIGENDFMIGSNSCLDLKTCKLDVSWCTDYPNEQIQFFIEGSDDWVHNEVVDQLEDLNPSDIEISFMTCQFCFHYAGKRLQGYILNTMEGYLDLISDDLHRYYQDKKISNYSERIAKMMKINNRIQKVIWEKRWKTELAQKFDIFHIQFSHPEMFYDCC